MVSEWEHFKWNAFNWCSRIKGRKNVTIVVMKIKEKKVCLTELPTFHLTTDSSSTFFLFFFFFTTSYFISIHLSLIQRFYHEVAAKKLNIRSVVHNSGGRHVGKTRRTKNWIKTFLLLYLFLFPFFFLSYC